MASDDDDFGRLDSLEEEEEEEEDWADTQWAEPKQFDHHSNTVIRKSNISVPSITGVHGSSHAGGLKMPSQDGVRSEGDRSLMTRMQVNDNKAGMKGLDKERINQIIYEASKGSKYYENERKKEEQMRKRIAEQRLRFEKLTEAQLQQSELEADKLLMDLEKLRDLSHTIVHVDMDAFYAAVEMRDDPSLKNKPMAVGGNSMLSTSNYCARRFGVRAAMPGFIGKKLCPDLVIVPLNFDKYTAVSRQIRSIMANYDPDFCPMSLDEAYLDITEHLEKRKNLSESERTYICRKREFTDDSSYCQCDLNVVLRHQSLMVGVEKGPADDKEADMKSYYHSSHALGDKSLPCSTLDHNHNIHTSEIHVCPECGRRFPPYNEITFGVGDEEAVRELRSLIEQRTRLTASAGIACNMMLSKVCSDLNKPNGQYKIEASREAVLEFIRDLSTRKISGIGKVSEALLSSLGVNTCQDLYHQRALLYHLFSPISFNYFMRISLGIGSTRVKSDSVRKSMSTERTFSELSRPEDLYRKCEELCAALAEDLQEEKLKGKTVGIKLKTVKFEVRTKAQTLSEHTNDSQMIFGAARELLKTEIQSCAPHPLRLRLMGVRLSSLLKESMCNSHRQNTITGLIQKMAARKSDRDRPGKYVETVGQGRDVNTAEAGDGLDVCDTVNRKKQSSNSFLEDHADRMDMLNRNECLATNVYEEAEENEDEGHSKEGLGKCKHIPCEIGENQSDKSETKNCGDEKLKVCQDTETFRSLSVVRKSHNEEIKQTVLDCQFEGEMKAMAVQAVNGVKLQQASSNKENFVGTSKREFPVLESKENEQKLTEMEQNIAKYFVTAGPETLSESNLKAKLASCSKEHVSQTSPQEASIGSVKQGNITDMHAQCVPKQDSSITSTEVKCTSSVASSSGFAQLSDSPTISIAPVASTSSQFVCPVCCRQTHCINLTQFNDHIDKCLGQDDSSKQSTKLVSSPLYKMFMSNNKGKGKGPLKRLKSGGARKGVSETFATKSCRMAIGETDNVNDFKTDHEKNLCSKDGKTLDIGRTSVNLPELTIRSCCEENKECRVVDENVVNNQRLNAFRENDSTSCRSVDVDVDVAILNEKTKELVKCGQKVSHCIPEVKEGALSHTGTRTNAKNDIVQVSESSEFKGDRTEGQTDPDSLLICPICNKAQRVPTLEAFNNHVDVCLSKTAITELLQEHHGNKRPAPSTTPSRVPSAKRKKTSAPKQHESTIVRSIESFFRDK